ncbi:MAG: hypothetical protein J7J67_02155 [Thermoproteales archaeon]|nr:hypothetical protein [Thermoproteales archaeon]
MDVIAVGSSFEIDALSMLGFEVIKAPELLSEDDIHHILGRILTSRLVVLEEDVYVQVKERLQEILETTRRPPLVVIVPTLKRGETYRLEELHNMISRAVGVRLKWKK